jgi:cytochrome c oxidase cbb3-type subunit 3
MQQIVFLTLSLILPLLSMAEGTEERALTANETMLMTAYVLTAFTVLLVIVIVVLLVKLKSKLDELVPKTEEQLAYEQQDFWSKVFQLHPLQTEKKLMMAHAYDGISELDNPTPPWFMFLFYSTIFFAVVYGIVYHAIGDGNIMQNEYVAEVKAADISREVYLKKFANSINEGNVTLVTTKEKIAEAKTIYDNNCVACHGSFGEGKVGPNLTDEYWIHGSDLKKIFHTISEGVAEKGMIAWKKQLNPLQIQLVSSYVMGMKGTNPPNPKAPQGEKEGAKTDTLTTDTLAKKSI